MRKAFFEQLELIMQNDSRVVLLTADLGFGFIDRIKEKFEGTQFFNCMAAEQLMILTAVGMTYEGKMPVCYSITPFLLHRPYEQIKLYIEHERAPIKLVGSGRGLDYKYDGVSHHDTGLPFGITAYYPQSDISLKNSLKDMIYKPEPIYINLKR